MVDRDRNHGSDLLIVSRSCFMKRSGGTYYHDVDGPYLAAMAAAFPSSVIASYVTDEGNEDLDHADGRSYTFPLGLQIGFRLITRQRRPTTTGHLVANLRMLFVLLGLVNRCTSMFAFVPAPQGVAACMFARLVGVPYVAYLGGDWRTIAEFDKRRWRSRSGFGRMLHGCYKTLLHRAMLIALRGAGAVLVTGETLHQVASTLNANTHRTFPVVNFRATDVVCSDRDLHGRRVHCLYVGSLVPSKGVVTLVRAVHLLREHGYYPRLTLVGSGDPEYIASIVSIARQLRVDDAVTLTGHVADKQTLLDHYRRAHVFTFASHSEGFPRVLYEAMSQGLPIVASRLPAIESAIGDCAKLVRPGDHAGFAVAVEELVRDGAAYAHMAQSGVKYVRDLLEAGEAPAQAIELLRQVQGRSTCA